MNFKDAFEKWCVENEELIGWTNIDSLKSDITNAQDSIESKINKLYIQLSNLRNENFELKKDVESLKSDNFVLKTDNLLCNYLVENYEKEVYDLKKEISGFLEEITGDE